MRAIKWIGGSLVLIPALTGTMLFGATEGEVAPFYQYAAAEARLNPDTGDGILAILFAAGIGFRRTREPRI